MPALADAEVVRPWIPFETRLRAHPTQLRVHAPSHPAAWTRAPSGARDVLYPAGALTLRGWYAVPADLSKARPVVVYLHNDFSLQEAAFERARPFLDAGYVLFLPSLRGENGNPGEFELLRGEVDDALAAVRWVAAQPMVDRRFIYVIGHSIGGGITSLLSLRSDVPIRRSANVGGVYRAATFRRWAERPATRTLIRFDLTDLHEVQLRLFIANLREVKHPHTLYPGRDDPFDTRHAALAGALARAQGAPVDVISVAGDHMGAITEAVQNFLTRIANDYAVLHGEK